MLPPISDPPLDFRRGVFPFRTMLGEFCQLRDRVRKRFPRYRGLHEPLRDQVGETSVGCRGVGVVSHRQPKVAGRRAASKIERILVSPKQLDHRQGKIGNFLRVSFAPPFQENFERRRARFVGELVTETNRKLGDTVPALRGPQDPAQRRESLAIMHFTKP